MSNFEVEELRLLAGVPYQIDGMGSVRPLKLREIAEMGEMGYNGSLGILCFNLDEILKDVPEDKRGDITAYDIVLSNYIRDADFKLAFEKAIRLFIGEDIFIREDGCFRIGTPESERVLDRDSFEVFRKVLMAQNGIEFKKEEDEVVAGNAQAQRFMEKLKKLKAKAPKEKGMSLRDLVSAVAWKSGIGIQNAYELTIYQLYDALKRISVVDNYDKTMTGLYAGTLDSKAIDIKKINWSQRIKED